MSIKINYKNNSLKNNSGKFIFFVDEKYTLSSLKKSLNKFEYQFIRDIISSNDLSKNIISFDINSKKKFFLIFLKKNIKSSEIENLGAKFFNYIKNFKQREFYIDSELLPTNQKQLIGHFLHGLKLKSYVFDKYKTKKNKKNITITIAVKTL